MNYVIVGPEMHRWHHVRSGEHQRTNFGNNLSILDWIFGTARLHPSVYPADFGIDEPTLPEGSILEPFLFAFRPHPKAERSPECAGLRDTA